jgi:hypothetical protein
MEYIMVGTWAFFGTCAMVTNEVMSCWREGGSAVFLGGFESNGVLSFAGGWRGDFDTDT